MPDAATVACPSCGSHAPATNRFCNGCGSALATREDAQPPRRSVFREPVWVGTALVLILGMSWLRRATLGLDDDWYLPAAAFALGCSTYWLPRGALRWTIRVYAARLLFLPIGILPFLPTSCLDDPLPASASSTAPALAAGDTVGR